MSAKQLRPCDRHGFALLDRTTPENRDVRKRWERRMRFFRFIKKEVEPARLDLVAAHWKLERINNPRLP